jgi:hypothetical protein
MQLLSTVWGDVPLDMALNLSPLQGQADISVEVARLSRLVRSTARGLQAGQGCLVTVMARPDDPLRLLATGLCAALEAASAALATALAQRAIRVHSVSVPETGAARATALLTQLSSHRLDDIPGSPFAL